MEEDNSAFIRKEREYDEEKRKKFEQGQKSGGKASILKRGYTKVSEKLHRDAEPYQKARSKITKPISEARSGIFRIRQERDLKRFQKNEERLEHQADIQEQLEIKRFGRKLTTEEHQRLAQHNLEQERKRSGRGDRLREGVQSFNRVADGFVGKLPEVENALRATDNVNYGRSAPEVPYVEPNFDHILYGPGGKPKPVKSKKKQAPQHDVLAEFYGIGKTKTSGGFSKNLDVVDFAGNVGKGKKKRKDLFEGLY